MTRIKYVIKISTASKTNIVQVNVIDVKLKPNAPEPRWDPIENAHCITADHVSCIVVRYIAKSWRTKQLHQNLPEGHFVVIPAPTRTYTVSIGALRRKIKLKQFYLVQAHALTGHKAQGMTIDKLTITRIWKYARKNSKQKSPAISSWPAWFYVALSRCKTASGVSLAIDKLPTLAYLCTPQNGIPYALASLQVLHLMTWKRLDRRVPTEKIDQAKRIEIKCFKQMQEKNGRLKKKTKQGKTSSRKRKQKHQ